MFENIVKIGEFLGVKHDEAFLRDVERSVAFENLKKEHAKSAGETDVWKHQGNGGRMPIYNKGKYVVPFRGNKVFQLVSMCNTKEIICSIFTVRIQRFHKFLQK